jgi:hypothetical protein
LFYLLNILSSKVSEITQRRKGSILHPFVQQISGHYRSMGL